jgi:hypothetical protein
MSGDGIAAARAASRHSASREQTASQGAHAMAACYPAIQLPGSWPHAPLGHGAGVR